MRKSCRDRLTLSGVVFTASFLLLATAAMADGLPAAIVRQLPKGYVVLDVAQGRLAGGTHDDYVIVLARPGDDPDALVGGGRAPARPLLLFARSLMGPISLPAATITWLCVTTRAANAIRSTPVRVWR
jgi:hypothetical protein